MDIQKFKDIFYGSSNAYGQTRKTDEYDDRGKHKTKSIIKKDPVTEKMWIDHLNGIDPALGIIPINEDSKCKWACIDIDVYTLNHKELIDKIVAKKLPLTVFRSKSGGAHVFLFTKEFAPAALFRNKLKDIAANIGYARSEIFPKQNHIKKERGDVGSFLNLPYHNASQTLRYAFKEDGTAMTIEEFFEHYENVVMTEEQLVALNIKEEKIKEDDLLKGSPPCLKMLAKEGIPNGKRNNAMYNFGIYCKKRFPDTWDTEIFEYNKKFCQPPLDKKEMDDLIKSITGKDYQYKCKDEPIVSFCNSRKCVRQEFGVGDDFAPGLEIKEIQKYTSNPPIFYVTIGEDIVECSAIELHDPDKFSLKCVEQINQAMLPVAKLIWRKQINKLLQGVIPIEAPEAIKTDIQLKELLTDFITRANGKKIEDIRKGVAFTEKGKSYFKFKSFWNFLLRSKSWNTKYETTMRMLQVLFEAEEEVAKLDNKSTRYLIVENVEIDKPIIRNTKIKKAPLHRKIIHGPPGTGKTFTLTKYLDKELNENKIDPQKIVYISFSNAAAREARRRIKDDLYHIGTMHSLGSNELEIDTNTQLLKGSRWNSFKNFSQICRDLSFESYVNEAGYVEYMNPNMKVIQYSRSRNLDLQQAAIDLDIIHLVDLGFVEQLNQDLKNFKDGTGMVEYSDMISQFVDKQKCPAIDVVFLDEAQDLSPLQWDMFFYIESVSIRSYVAGDDDQTIYTFQGADPDIFINLKGDTDPQIISRRVPKKIHKLAESIFPYMSQRLDKQWKPREAEGNIYEDVVLEELDLNSGNWMLLARTNKMLEPIKEYLYDMNLRFDAKNHSLLPEEMLNAYRVWQRLHQGATVNKKDVEDLWSYLTVKHGHVERGYAGGKTLRNIKSVDLDELRSDHGLRATGSWETLNFPDASKDYIRTILKNGDDLMKPARIKVSTIHGVKGEECDNVVLYTDIEKIIYDAALKDPDPEHRLFFVGITRARENLYLPQAMGDYQYNIGGPIV